MCAAITVKNQDLPSVQSLAAKALAYYGLIHVPAIIITGYVLGDIAWGLVALSALLAISCLGSVSFSKSALLKHNMLAVCMMGQVMLFLACFKGHPWQIDVHMYFFAMLGMLAALVDWRTILVATVVVALHHLILYFALPAYVFPGQSSLFRVIFHAVILLIESAVLISITRLVGLSFTKAAASQAEAENALAAVKQSAEERDRLTQKSAEERRQTLEALANEFESSVSTLIQSVGNSTHKMSSHTDRLMDISLQTKTQLGNIDKAGSAAADNSASVAAATEELSSSIHEISQQIQNTSSISQEAIEKSLQASEVISKLSHSSGQISSILDMINEIAGKINLLALNATIEAARAGEAGRGFAVVASEVKTLANQTAEATDKIAIQIQEMLGNTENVVTSMEDIQAIIGQINQAASGVAVAIEQQTAATSDITMMVQRTADSASDISRSISSATTEADNAQQASVNMRELVDDLSRLTESLKSQSGDFLTQVRKS
ncbi:MAG: methyl-accepting chemotaxis protein [Micavibrio sp.]